MEEGVAASRAAVAAGVCCPAAPPCLLQVPPGVGGAVATVAVADAVEDHPRLRLEDRRAELLPEPISGNADRRFHRPEQVEVGVPRSQLVSDGLDEVARPRTRLRLVAEDDGLDGAEAVVRPDQRPCPGFAGRVLWPCTRGPAATP